MNSGRKANPAPEQQVEVLDPIKVTAATSALDTLSAASREVAERFGDGLPYERNRVLGQAQFFMEQSATAMLELGKCLIQMKENETHGEFTELVTARLNISVRSAQLMMQAAAKYLSPTLIGNAKPISLLGKSKLFDLMSESDEDLAALADGGTLAGKTLDEMASMTRRELQAALTESKKLAAAKDKIIAKKNAKLDELEASAELLVSDEVEALRRLREHSLEAEMALNRALQTIDDVMARPPTEASDLAARQSVDYLVRKFIDACEARGITVDLAEQVAPAWVAPIADAVAAGAARKAAKG